jgi:DNA-3-methyladenine glycosylase I
MGTEVVRCPWVPTGDPLYTHYHDDEWGTPSHDDRHLFEMLVLEGAQAGLSWSTILRKRDGYRRAFAGFDADAVARFDEADRARLLADAGIVRNRAKVAAAIANAQAVLRVREEFGSLDAYLWGFVGGRPLRNRWTSLAEMPAETGESRAMSRELKRHGFAFVGPTVCYSLMEAVGMVNDHTVDCFRWADLDAGAGS